MPVPRPIYELKSTGNGLFNGVNKLDLSEAKKVQYMRNIKSKLDTKNTFYFLRNILG